MVTPAPAPRIRFYLGKRADLFSAQRVYRFQEGLEIDDVEQYDIIQKRVFFDDILLVTYHRFIDLMFLFLTGGFATCTGLVAVLFFVNDQTLVAIAVFLLTCLPFAVAFVLRLALRVDVVTVFGKRTSAQMHFWLRKRRAREVFAQVCRMAQERQMRLARQAGPPTAPAAS